MVDEAKQGCRAIDWRAAHQANTAVSLGDALGELIESRISPQQTRFGLISEALGQMLPTELCQHCRIVDISRGRLKVITDSPSYMYELQLLSCELLKELARRCPRARIKEIRFAVS